ncbi:hypothetical protein F2Q69_00023154 [Brassica cretica]|uniref:Uncharacterized protein n=1 Tax=Brassica cretica TaxID=69181 RepID=A0A8S9Q7F2_BRACR|nr:hypothetical protein F2Q69_00023154 [Brassica cretica]
MEIDGVNFGSHIDIGRGSEVSHCFISSAPFVLHYCCCVLYLLQSVSKTLKLELIPYECDFVALSTDVRLRLSVDLLLRLSIDADASGR